MSPYPFSVTLASATLFSATLALDVVIKVSVLLLMGSLSTRKRSAATQHRWWTLGFVGCLLIPAITLMMPTWTLPILPQSTQLNETLIADNARVSNNLAVTASTPANIVQQAPDQSLPLTQQSSAISEPTKTLGGRPATDTKGSANTLATTPTKASVALTTEYPWTQALLTFWIVGIILCWLRSVWQQVLLKRLLYRCVRLDDAKWNELLSSCSQPLGLRLQVTLLNHQTAHSPVSAGVWHPVVILPNNAESWNSDHRRLVLLHELAHVARRDVLTQTLAGLVCGLYWFNPLGWYGLFQMRKLRELACDDLVLSCGQRPSGYANVLLDVARSYQHQSYSTAVGMAHSTNVENRIMAILDKTRRHVSLSRTAARLLLASTTCSSVSTSNPPAAW